MRIKITSLGALATGALAAAVVVAGATTGQAPAAATAGQAGAAAGPAGAAAGPAGGAKTPAVRTAHLPNCGGDSYRACKGSPWYLYLRDGRWMTFPDATRHPVEANGKRVDDRPPPFAVSGDGSTIAYVRARDNRVVARRWPGGKPVVMTVGTKGVGTNHTDLRLAPDGRRLLVSFADAEKKRPGLVIDTATGKPLRTIPAAERPQSFSADGDEVLSLKVHSDDTIEMLAYPVEDGEPVTDTPYPAVVSEWANLALAADGHTVLVHTSPKDKIRAYDLSARAWTGPAKPIKVKHDVPTLVWGPGGRLELHTLDGSDQEGRWTTQIYALNPRTGATKRIDKYTIPSGVPKKR
ncbi:YncE family protein [Nonomuraea sp. NPDC049480]|uniref:YncE family protein n=1 Tax=Nonomuraea sp. NPDC049480 TaxID=3364353 RepID=UPI003797FC3B